MSEWEWTEEAIRRSRLLEEYYREVRRMQQRAAAARRRARVAAAKALEVQRAANAHTHPRPKVYEQTEQWAAFQHLRDANP